MKKTSTILFLAIIVFAVSCSEKEIKKKPKLEEKGFQVSPTAGSENLDSLNGLNGDSLKFETRPSNVLLTGVPNVRLTTIYKVNIDRQTKRKFIGSNYFHYSYDYSINYPGDRWNDHLIPGIEIAYGYNMVNVSHFDISKNEKKYFFENPGLIYNLYFPSFSKDTLNNKPVSRNYFIVSIYNEDTNEDGYINLKDLRRLLLFDINGDFQKALVPENYSVFKSEYDSDNDYMYVFAIFDSNDNGKRDDGEPTHVFWIDMKNPLTNGQLYY